MLTEPLKRIFNAFKLVSFGASGPGAIPQPYMEMEPSLSREQLEVLLEQTPSIPQDSKEPVHL